MEYIPDTHDHIVHVYRRDEPHGAEQALCGWRPPNTWHPRSGPAPLTALPHYKRCPICLEHVAREPDQLYALMPPEDWRGWEGTATPEPAPSVEPEAIGPRESKATAAVAKASASARPPWNRKAWWGVSAGLILVVIAVVVVAVASGGGDNSSSTGSSDSRAANAAPSGKQAAAKQSKPESTPASSGQGEELPLRDGDWQLDRIRVQNNGYGEFLGIAHVTFTGDSSEGKSQIFTVTLFKDGKAVATLQGQANSFAHQDAADVQLASSDRWVGGPYTYDFRTEL